MKFAPLTENIEWLAQYYPHKPAVVFRDRRITYRELNQGINRVAHALIDMGIKKGDKIALLNTNCVEMLESMYGALKAGGALVLLNSMVRGQTLKYMLDDSDSAALICGEAFTSEINQLKAGLPPIKPDRYICTGSSEVPGYMSFRHIRETYSQENPGLEILPEDIFSVSYTSGTTGDPKGIIHNHNHRFDFALGHLMEWSVGFQSTVCISTPMYHNAAAILMTPALFIGAAVVVMDKFDPKEWLELVQKEKVTHGFLVPTQFIMVMAQPDFKSYDLGSLQFIISSGAPLTKKTKEDILANFKCHIGEAYGLTEGIATFLKPLDMMRKIGSVGKPILGGAIRIVDDDMKDVAPGEIGEIAGFNPAWNGYYKKPELTAETEVDGWLRTGDLGRLDEEGYIYLQGRKKDMIVSGGVNVFPEDIESVMMRHPKVREVSVFGVPHDKWGEAPRAAVILKQGQQCTQEELIEWTNTQVNPYQKISGVDFTQDLPRNPTGKVLKRLLRAPYWADREKEI